MLAVLPCLDMAEAVFAVLPDMSASAGFTFAPEVLSAPKADPVVGQNSDDATATHALYKIEVPASGVILRRELLCGW